MEKIKLGQIGIGHNHGNGKMEAVRKFPELFQIVGYAEDDEEWIKKRGNLDCYKDLKRMSVDELIEKCDAILVETDVWNLTKTAQKCIDAGKHIHLDKPASGTLAEYEHLLNSAKEKGLTVQLGYMYRYNDALNRVKSMIQNGELGDIYQIDAEMSTYHSPEYRKWLKHFKGGSMYIFGCHLIDLAISMLGEPKNVVSFLKQTGYENAYSDDNCFAVLEYEKAIVRITTLSVEVNGFNMRRFAVMGSKGTVEIKPIEGSVEMTLSTPSEKLLKLDIDDIRNDCRYDEMVKDFYAFVTGTKENPYSFGHELTLQRVLHRAVGLD